MIFKLYLLISVITIFAFSLIIKSCEKKLKKEEKDLIKRNSTNGIEDALTSMLTLCVLCFCPVLNIYVLYLCTIKSEGFKKEIIRSTLSKFK